MQSFVGKLTHTSPSYYCSRSARPRALPAGLSVVAADWPHVLDSEHDGSSGIQHHHLRLGDGFEFRHEESHPGDCAAPLLEILEWLSGWRRSFNTR